jgi:hypothetical protein
MQLDGKATYTIDLYKYMLGPFEVFGSRRCYCIAFVTAVRDIRIRDHTSTRAKQNKQNKCIAMSQYPSCKYLQLNPVKEIINIDELLQVVLTSLDASMQQLAG